MEGEGEEEDVKKMKKMKQKKKQKRRRKRICQYDSHPMDTEVVESEQNKGWYS